MDGIELKELRKKREKHFLQENGDIIAQVYNEDIHYLKDGEYKEIDNTLIRENNYYKNKDNDYQAYFKDRSSNEFMKLILEDSYFKLILEDSNNVLPIVDNTSIKYLNIKDGINFEYLLLPKKVKENIIIQNKEAAKQKILFNIKTNLMLDIVNNEIHAFKGDRTIFTIENPFMVDNNGIQNNNIYYHLVKEELGYQLELILDNEWLETANYPVIIDPTINTTDEQKEVYDTYIYPGDTNVDRNNQDILKVGVEEVDGKKIINRALIKFDLPTIGTGSQVIEATLNLIGYGSLLLPHSEIINVHEINSNWTEKGANWNTMNNKYNSHVEASFEGYRSNLEAVFDEEDNLTRYNLNPVLNEADITSLVKKWYSDSPNYGIMLKANKEVLKSPEVPAFYSKNNNVGGYSPKPVLIIKYRNQNGIEDYMDYKIQNFTEGSSYFNTYNGNLTGIFHIGNTIGGKLPASLSLIYNTNDVVLKNDIGIGLGIRFNLNQIIKPSLIKKYLEYIDCDGTIHYFYNVIAEDGSILNYQDEDGLNLTIEKTDAEYILIDKEGNKSKFKIDNDVGYLSEIIDISDNHNIIQYDSNHRIIKVVDANDSEISIIYEENKITVTSPNETVILNYNDNKLLNIVSKIGTTLFSYNSNSLVETITDINGQKIKYEYYEQIPYRIKKISQYGLNDTLGQYFSVIYGFNSTTLIDNKNRSTILTYNNIGNLISTSNLKTENDLKSAYGLVQEYGYGIETDSGEYSFHKNKLLSNGIPVKYVKNYLTNSSFEEDDLGFITDCESDEFHIFKSNQESVSGKYSLEVVLKHMVYGGEFYRNVSVPKGKYYTYSFYFWGAGSATVIMNYNTLDGEKAETLEVFNREEKFNRYELTIYYSEEAISDLKISMFFLEAGVYYIDDIQLEEGEVANKYNMLDNSDFSLGLDGWDIGVSDIEEEKIINDEEVFEIVTINDLNDKALKINMNPAHSSFFSKTYQVNGKKGDEYNISFWYKNEGFKTTGIMGDPVRNEVTISYEYVDNGEEDGHCTLSTPIFNPNDKDWQYYSTTFVAEKDFTSLTLYFDQSCNANAFYITNLYLFKDVRENYYNYDELDNMISFYGLNKEKTKYNYDSNNQLVQMINPKGDRFTYEYDNNITDRVIGGISESGLAELIKYDSFGNPIITRIKSVGFSLDENKLYLIRAKGTSNYLRCIQKSISLNNDSCGHDKWQLEKVDDKYYRIKYPILENQYLKKVMDTLSITNKVEDSDLFKITRNANGSYYIQMKRRDYNPEITKSDIEVKYNEAILNNLTLSDYLYSFVESGYASSTKLEKYIQIAKEIDLFTDDMLLQQLSNIVIEESMEQKINKEELIEFSYNIVNDEENPICIQNNGNVVILSELIEDDSSFEFYFEDTNSNLFLESSSTYTDDGKFITSTVDTNFNTISYDIDTNSGLIKSVTDAKGNTTSTIYDDKDRPIIITSGEKQIEYSYNEQSQLSKISEENKEYNFIYDDFGNIHQVKIGDDITLVTNTYEDNNGNLKKSIYGNGNFINYDYDEFDRIKTIEKMDDTYHLKYDNNGNLTRINSSSDNRQYIYDLSKKLSEYRVDDFKVDYTYDQNNNLINVDYSLDYIENSVFNTLNEDDIVIKTEFNDQEINYNYDNLGRLINRNINDDFNINYEYVSHGKRTSPLVKSIDNNGDKYFYKYDKLGNIIKIYHNKELENEYSYDQYNELIQEKNYLINQKIDYVYDNYGNILSKTYFDLTSGELKGERIFEYNNSKWNDQLTIYNGNTITYDAIGNPIKIENDELMWINGRQLQKYNSVQYQYNSNRIRISKSINNIKTKYYLEDSKIIFEQTGNDVIYYIYNDVDDLIGFKYNSTIYYYIKNYLNDIIGILDSNYNMVVRYTYDSWGDILSIKDGNNNDVSTNINHIANINPFRYRSYYYDVETNLYYLNSRYYNPKWGRFLNADGVMAINVITLNTDSYIYCGNNPIMNNDRMGLLFSPLAKDFLMKKEIQKVTCGVTNKLKDTFKNLCDSFGKSVKTNNNSKNFLMNTNPYIPAQSKNGQLEMNMSFGILTVLNNADKSSILSETYKDNKSVFADGRVCYKSYSDNFSLSYLYSHEIAKVFYIDCDTGAILNETAIKSEETKILYFLRKTNGRLNLFLGIDISLGKFLKFDFKLGIPIYLN